MSRSVTLFPNDFISLPSVTSNGFVALEPRTDSKVFASSSWPRVQIVQAIDNEIRLLDSTSEPIFILKNEQKLTELKSILQ